VALPATGQLVAEKRSVVAVTGEQGQSWFARAAREQGSVSRGSRGGVRPASRGGRVRSPSSPSVLTAKPTRVITESQYVRG